ncbi:MAG: hypothetical protein OXD54_13430 [Candidatus Poribacteria bacterium]|nr:hypothetical protein [Candidatus Poribacteria bacterium]
MSKRSHIAFIWDTIQMELGVGNEGGHASIFHKRTGGVNPVRIPFPDPLYDNLIVLHERSSQDNHIIDFANGFSALRPQMILTLYPDGQTSRNIAEDNVNKFYTSNTDNISDYDPAADVFCFFDNTYVFPSEATWHFIKNIDEFKSKYMTDYPHTRYDLRVVFPENVNSWKIFYDFHNALKGESKEIIEEDKSLTTGVFSGRIQVVPDPEAEQMIARSIAKVAFHCFLYHYPEYTGHESRYDQIKDFIYEGNGTPTDFVMSAKDIELESLVYNTTNHRHYLRFFMKGENVGCQIDFFTGLLPNVFSYNVILAGDPDNTHPTCDRVEYIPFSVHPKSPVKKRILSQSELRLIYIPRRNDRILWYSNAHDRIIKNMPR